MRVGVDYMVEIFNIKVDENLISCNYSPEDSGLAGKVVVDVNSEEITDIEYSKYIYGKKMYVAHVRKKLMDLFKSESPIPDKVTATWY